MTPDPLDSGAVDWIYAGDLTSRGFSDADLKVLARVLALACPHCEAQPGRWCRTANGRQIESLDGQHATRRRQWQAGGKKDPGSRRGGRSPQDSGGGGDHRTITPVNPPTETGGQ